jgi:hypothetical protein
MEVGSPHTLCFSFAIKGSDYFLTRFGVLKKGDKYSFSVYISPDDSCGYSVNNIDILFNNYEEF